MKNPLFLPIRRVFREHAYQNRLQQRLDRQPQDQAWNEHRSITALHARDFYESREEMPAFLVEQIWERNGFHFHIPTEAQIDRGNIRLLRDIAR